MRRRITYLTTGLTLGGAEIQLTRIAIGMRSRGWEVDVVSMLPPVDLVEELEGSNVPVRTLGMHPVPNPLAIFRLAGILRRNGATVLHSHMAKANFLGRVAGRLAGVPVQVSTAHNIVEGGRFIELAYRLTDKFADVTTNVSRRAVDRYVEIGAVSPARARLMYNGLDVSKFGSNGITRERYRRDLGVGSDLCWLAVGRLAPGKDYPNLIRAFSKVTSEGSDVRLLIVGKGTLGAELERQVSEAGLTECVTFLGERKDVAEIMSAADAFVMSSAWEGAPMVLLEASASRLPVVTTDVGGNAELIRHGETGIVVPSNDDAALAEAMLKLMRMSTDERARLGAAGRVFVEREFSMHTVLDRWEDLYEDLIEQKTG